MIYWERSQTNGNVFQEIGLDVKLAELNYHVF